MKEILKQEKTSAKKLEKDVVNRPESIRRLKKIASFIKKGEVLDIGCAIGELSKYINLKEVKYTGIDNSKERINIAKKRETNRIKFICGSGEKLPFKKERFDYVIIAEIIEHVENPAKFLRECKRVLKKGGKIIGSTPNATDFVRIFKAILRRDHGSKQHLCVFGTYEIKTLLKYVGLKKRKIKFTSFRLLPKVRAYSRFLSWLFPNLSEGFIFIGEK
jgi:2-polyprenyl-3-methyl-5-hydroxy-6-metoxy-1,4-benzoquinol methylase